MFREPRAQGKAIGVYSFVASAGGAVGLLAGGVLTQAINWHWIFFINLPVGIVTAILTVRLIDHDKGIGFERGIDLPGAILAVGALMIGVYSILEAGQYGWASPRTLGLAAGALMLLGGFIVREARASNPLMPLRLFRSRNMNGANLVQVLSVAGMFGMFFLGALYLQRVLGFSAMEVGLGFLPVTVVMGALSLGVSGRLTLRFGPRATLVPSLVLIALALALLARAPVGGTYLRDVLPVLLLLGTGAGIGFPALMTLAMSGSSRSDAGLASGLVNTSAQVGGAVGLAVLATLSATRTEQLLARGESTIAALTGGYQLAFIVAAGLMVAAIGVSLAVLRSPNLAEADFAGAVEAESDAA
jgi:MFS family permease